MTAVAIAPTGISVPLPAGGAVDIAYLSREMLLNELIRAIDKLEHIDNIINQSRIDGSYTNDTRSVVTDISTIVDTWRYNEE